MRKASTDVVEAGTTLEDVAIPMVRSKSTAKLRLQTGTAKHKFKPPMSMLIAEPEVPPPSVPPDPMVKAEEVPLDPSKATITADPMAPLPPAAPPPVEQKPRNDFGPTMTVDDLNQTDLR